MREIVKRVLFFFESFFILNLALVCGFWIGSIARFGVGWELKVTALGTGLAFFFWKTGQEKFIYITTLLFGIVVVQDVFRSFPHYPLLVLILTQVPILCGVLLVTLQRIGRRMP